MEITTTRELINQAYDNVLDLATMLQPNNPLVNISQAIELSNSIKKGLVLIDKELENHTEYNTPSSQREHFKEHFFYNKFCSEREELEVLYIFGLKMLDIHITAYERHYNTKIIY